MEKIETINGIEYVASYNEQCELLYRYIKPEEQGESIPSNPIDPLTLPTTKGDIIELSNAINENTLETQYLTSLTELGL